jgi:uncharacterized DUF497 family protein
MIIEFDPAKNAKNITECGLDFGFVVDFDWSTAQIDKMTERITAKYAIKQPVICKAA